MKATKVQVAKSFLTTSLQRMGITEGGGPNALQVKRDIETLMATGLTSDQLYRVSALLISVTGRLVGFDPAQPFFRNEWEALKQCESRKIG